MCLILKWVYIFTEEKGYSVRSPCFVQHILIQLCNATPAMLPANVNTGSAADPRVSGCERQWQLFEFAAASCVCHCNGPLPILVTARTYSPAFLVSLFPSLSMQYILAQCLLLLLFASWTGMASPPPLIFEFKKKKKSLALPAKKFGSSSGSAFAGPLGSI